MMQHVYFALAIAAIIAVGVVVMRLMSRRTPVKAGLTVEGESSGSYKGLRGANLRNADLKYIELRYGDVAGGTHKGLEGADLRGADLTDAHLTAARMSGAFLAKATLKGATLVQADLSEADLRGADLTGASLVGANLEGARYNDATKFPVGFDPDARGMEYVARLEVSGDFAAVGGTGSHRAVSGDSES